ncbi:hypothetical protein F4Z99_01725 [Candidatus Poribacteria bacterium]|nr:hypothetical protein [Candidatus Poribacteria bacterium]MYB00892.1 hypothetical protein [Candidatus Poribacteria bacterium]
MKLLSHLLVFAIGIGLYTTTAASADTNNTPPWQPTGKYIHPDIRESSGIVASRQFEGVYWTLNDSGNPATLYATKLNGELIGEIAVKGSRNFDWEALGIDDKNQLWIGEIGNNSRLRFDLKVVVVSEPDPFTETEAEVIESYPYRYPNENVDAEGLFIVEGIPYIVSKERGRAVLYRFPTLQTDTKQVLERVGEFAGAKFVTGAGVSEDGTRLAVCTYDALWIYHSTAGDLAKMIQGTPWYLPHSFYGEAVCFDGYNLVLTNEARDLYAVPQFWYEKEWTLPPKNTQSAIDLRPKTTTHGVTVLIERYRAEGIDIGGHHVTYTPRTIGKTGSLTVQIEAPYTDIYEIRAVLTRGQEYAHVQLSANGTAVGTPYDCYSPEPIAGTLVSFGTAPLNAGENQIMLSIVGKAPEATDHKIGVDSYQVLHASPFVKRYRVLGPFPKTDIDTIDELLRPEGQLNLKKTYTGIDGKAVHWQEATTRADGFLDLRRDLSPTPMTVGYTLVYVHAPKPTDAVMLIGSDDEFAVWLNGTEIHRKSINAGATADRDAIPCQLQAGWNTVLCQKVDNGWSWGLYLRFTDADRVLRYAIHPTE